jgi:copper(I)-binding protein
LNAQPRRLLVATALFAATASLVLTGCGVGQRAQTAVESAVVDGVGGNVGTISLRAVSIAPAAEGVYLSGTDADLQLVMINSAGSEDQLVAVTTTGAQKVEFYPNLAAANVTPPPVTTAPSTPSPSASSSNSLSTPSVSTPASSSGSASDSTSAGASAAPTASASTASASAASTSASPVSNAVTDIAVPAGGITTVGGDSSNPVIRLSGLNQPLSSAATIQITFTFKNAGSVTLTVAVHLSTTAATPQILPTAQSSGD